jgi:uncharacterized membrane protein SpoIIM required for sporulation
MEDKISKRVIVYVTIGLTSVVSIFCCFLLIHFSPSGANTSEYNAMGFVFSTFLTFINSLTCLTALQCLKPKIMQNNLYYNLSLYGLLFIFNIFIIYFCFPTNDGYYRTREAIELVTPLIVFFIGQTFLGIILKKQD